MPTTGDVALILIGLVAAAFLWAGFVQWLFRDEHL
jgi:hypothetical protein